MKKILTIVLVLIGQQIYCQDYFFDKFIEYSEIDRASVFFMFNSKDSTYFFYSKNFSSDLAGTIFDNGQKMTHSYKIENYKKELDFTYLYSQSFIKENHVCYDEDTWYETKQVYLDSLPSFEIRRLNKNKKQVVLATTTVQMAPENLNCFSTIMEYLFHHFICCHQLNLPPNYMPDVASIKYSNGKKLKTKLVQTQNINTSLSIKKEGLKYKK